jgi:hypothetical protein
MRYAKVNTPSTAPEDVALQAAIDATAKTKAQEFVDYLNARIARSGYNERQVQGNKVFFSVMQGKKYARIVQGGDSSQRSAYAFVDAEGNIYKAAGYKAPAKGVRATVDQVVSGNHPFFGDGSVARGFHMAAYSTSWLYAS